MTDGNDGVRNAHQQDSAKYIRSWQKGILSHLSEVEADMIAKVSESHGWDSIHVYSLKSEAKEELVSIKYLSLNQKTQVITPSLLGEMVYEVVDHSIRQLLNPELTASWEKGLTYVAEGSITSDEYMEKLERFVAMRTVNVTRLNNQYDMRGLFDAAAAFYKTKKEN